MFNDLKFPDLCCFLGVLPCSWPRLWVPQENLSRYPFLNIYHKVTIAIKCRLIGDSLYQKFVDIEPGLLELFENVTGVRFFFETQCSNYVCKMRRFGGIRLLKLPCP